MRISNLPRRGATMVLICLLLPALLLVCGFVINLAYVQVTSTEVHIAVDAATRAAGREYAKTGDKTLALTAAQNASRANPLTSGLVVPIEAGDLAVGFARRSSSTGKYNFISSDRGNAVRITTNTLNRVSGQGIQPILPIPGMSSAIKPLRVAVSTQCDIDIALVIDRSGSMAYAANEVAAYPPIPMAAPAGWDFGDPVPPNARWLDLIAAVNTFNGMLNMSPQIEQLSLTTYNDSGNTPVGLTQTYSDALFELHRISTNFISGKTNIGGGMISGLNSFSGANARADASRVMVLMTDGVHNTGQSPTSAATQIADEGVMIFTITFSDEAQQGTMQNVAAIGGGKHFHAVDATQLSEAFRQIARELPNILTE